jgi:hypothetical protein
MMRPYQVYAVQHLVTCNLLTALVAELPTA